jgi:GntR family transcriptional regulator / MocR family aminotransferase
MPIDLFIAPGAKRQTSAQLYAQIRDATASGRVSPGDRLPTTRELALELGVARSTVTAVYARLVGEGILEARTGDGTFVAEHGQRSRGRVTTALSPRRSAPMALPSRAVAELRIDLRTGRPDPLLFPIVDWRRAITEAVRTPPPGYGHPAGLPALREALAVWVRKSRGVNATAEQIVVTSGAQGAFDLIARVMLKPGDIVAIEDPGYSMARRAFEHHGLRSVAVPVDPEGIVVEQIPRTARAVYVTPSHQSPTGVTMTPTRRRALLAHAERFGMAIIEDDYDTEFRHVDRPLEPVQRLDNAGRVLYVGTFSKTLSPSLRLGFVVVPGPIVEAFIDARSLIDTQPPHVTQAALCTLISNGRLERHLRRVGRVYTTRHAAVQDHLERLHDDGLIEQLLRSNAGLHHMIALPGGMSAESVAWYLALEGIAIQTTAEWWVADPPPGLMIGFGTANVEQLDQAFASLRTVLEPA